MSHIKELEDKLLKIQKTLRDNNIASDILMKKIREGIAEEKKRIAENDSSE